MLAPGLGDPPKVGVAQRLREVDAMTSAPRAPPVGWIQISLMTSPPLAMHCEAA